MRPTCMSTSPTRRPGRWLAPLLAALAVLAVVATLWMQRPGASGGDVGFADGGSGQGSPSYGGSTPGSAGSDEPAPDAPAVEEPWVPDVPVGSVPPAGTPSDGGGVDSGTIAVDSFYAYDATHLALNYTNGVPECYGAAGTPRVEESADAVVVTIPRTPVRVDGKRACIDIAMLGTVDATLDAPLAGRPVLDGARHGARVREAAAPNDPDQAS
ncbi:MAG: hypothetical protein ACTHKG_21225 [Nocardioides sp.]